MPFVKGQSGNPGGRLTDKPWAEALRIAVSCQGSDGKRRLRNIAEKCVSAAENGDMQAMKEIGDRLDGKPKQESTVTVRNELDSFADREIRELIRRELAADGGNGAAAEEQPDPSQIN
jgi:hypothetical protein